MASMTVGGDGGGGTDVGGGGISSTSARVERNGRTTALLAKLAEADDSLAQVLDLAAQAIDTLPPSSSSTTDSITGPSVRRLGSEEESGGGMEQFESSTTEYFALLNDIQLFLRSAVFHLVHAAKRAPLTPAQTTTAFDALRAATVTKGHSLRPVDVARQRQDSAMSSAQVRANEHGSAKTAERYGAVGKARSAKGSVVGLSDDAHLSIGALRLQHQTWTDLAAALEALR
ncbi:unnamed protein product [Tilletia controversa]|nr:unnamed protein product [Tilletia controversa]